MIEIISKSTKYLENIVDTHRRSGNLSWIYPLLRMNRTKIDIVFHSSRGGQSWTFGLSIFVVKFWEFFLRNQKSMIVPKQVKKSQKSFWLEKLQNITITVCFYEQTLCSNSLERPLAGEKVFNVVVNFGADSFVSSCYTLESNVSFNIDKIGI